MYMGPLCASLTVKTLENSIALLKKDDNLLVSYAETEPFPPVIGIEVVLIYSLYVLPPMISLDPT